MTVGPDAGAAADQDVLHHLAPVAQAHAGAPVHVVARVCARRALSVREVGLRRERVDPAADQVRGHRVVHEQVGDPSAVAVLGDVHVDLVAQDLWTIKTDDDGEEKRAIINNKPLAWSKQKCVSGPITESTFDILQSLNFCLFKKDNNNWINFDLCTSSLTSIPRTKSFLVW